MRFVLIAAFAGPCAAGHSPLDRASLLRLTQTARPQQANEAFDCAWRRLAALFAPRVLPPRFRTAVYAKRLHDALQLEGLCGEPFSRSAEPSSAAEQHPRHAASPGAASDLTFYVSPSGNDNATGTLSAPLRTLAAAVDAVRAARRRGAVAEHRHPPASILLRAGTHYLANPIELLTEDSFLTISSYEAEAAILSGIDWSRVKIDIILVEANDRAVTKLLASKGYSKLSHRLHRDDVFLRSGFKLLGQGDPFALKTCVPAGGAAH